MNNMSNDIFCSIIPYADYDTFKSLMRATSYKGKLPKDVVNHKDSVGDTFLHEACFFENLDIVKILIENGADVNVENDDGDAPMCSTKQNLEIIELLIENGAKMWDGQLQHALICKDWEIAETLIKHGADVNGIDGVNSRGRTLLQYARRYGYTEAVKFLINHGATK